MWIRTFCVVTVVGLLAALVSAQRLALFLDDGARLDVREYEIVDGRVRYFSLARGQWEEVPVEIVDLERTQVHNRTEQAAAAVRAQEERRERLAERRARTELHRVPLEDGVYYLKGGPGGEPVALEQVFFDVGKSKKRAFLNIIAPVPVITGKQTLSIKALAAKTVTRDEKPAFFLRLDSFSRFGISRVKPDKEKDRRIVQEIYTVPRSEEQLEAQDEVDVFRQQLAPLVYKVWPVEPLEPGEYAVVAYTPGETDLRAWDFSHKPRTSSEKP